MIILNQLLRPKIHLDTEPAGQSKAHYSETHLSGLGPRVIIRQILECVICGGNSASLSWLVPVARRGVKSTVASS